MTDFLRHADVRTVVTLVVLDLVTYVAVYWLIVPAFDPVLKTLPSATALAVGMVLSVVRLTLVGFFAARSLRARRGFDHRSDAVPSVAVGGVAAMAFQVVLGVLAALATGAGVAVGSVLVSAVEWVVFPLIGLLFVAPGRADAFYRSRRVPLR